MWKFYCLSQIRPLNCGRWVRETRDQRDTTWKMRRDGSRTYLPSPLCRCTHTQACTHLHMQHFDFSRFNWYQVDFGFANLVPDFCAFSLTLIWPLTPFILSFLSFLLSPFSLFLTHTLFPSFFYLRCRCWNPQIWWWRSVPDECLLMAIPTMSTPSQSTATGRPTCPLMTSASICGTWASQTAASVSFPTPICFLCPTLISFLIPQLLINNYLLSVTL